MRTFNAELSYDSLMNLAKELDAYADSLETKCVTFISRLAELGIQTSVQASTGKYGAYVRFYKTVNPTKDGCDCIMYGSNTGMVTETWMINSSGDTKSVDVSPILMLEFGSGPKAINIQNVPGVGQGTFPEQTHAYDSGGWSYRTTDGEWHHSTGYSPKMPMYRAFAEMYASISHIAKQVFGE